MNVVKISEIIAFLDKIDEKYKFVGDDSDFINGYSSLYNYKENTITWARDIRNIDNSNSENYKLIIFSDKEDIYFKFKNYIKVDNPHRIFFYIIKEFYVSEKKPNIGLNNVISDSAIIGKDVTIGNNCVIGSNVIIGDNTTIYNNVVLCDNVIIGSNCLIKSGAVIGEEGFGFLTTKAGMQERVTHLGSVIIEDNVEIGSNTCIDRGVMEDTIIRRNAKIDNLCHIAHNTDIGKNTLVVALTLLGGSTKIGENCWIGTSTIRNLLKIGDNAFIGIGSNVVSDIEAGSLVYGNPAKAKQK